MGIVDNLKNWWNGNNKPVATPTPEPIPPPAPKPKPIVRRPRIYNFELPYTINSFYVRIGVGKLQSDGLFDGLPYLIRNKLVLAANGWTSVDVTQDELDSIDDTEWAALADMLGLSWQSG
jgi:hypothetical protein